MKKIIIALVFVIACTSLTKGEVEMTSDYGFDDRSLQEVINFENLYIDRLTFKGEELVGKSYVVEIVEYRDGLQISSEVLFNGAESDYFKVGSREETINFYFKPSGGKLKVQLWTKKAGSKKLYYDLYGKSDTYVLKNFFSDASPMPVDLNEKNAVLAVITPSVHEDGSASYCEVAQSEVDASEFGTRFNIPHYFIVTIEFK